MIATLIKVQVAITSGIKDSISKNNSIDVMIKNILDILITLNFPIPLYPTEPTIFRVFTNWLTAPFTIVRARFFMFGIH